MIFSAFKVWFFAHSFTHLIDSENNIMKVNECTLTANKIQNQREWSPGLLMYPSFETFDTLSTHGQDTGRYFLPSSRREIMLCLPIV